MIITLISFKGGVGKSTMSQNLAVSFAHRGMDVCILDADPNHSSIMWHEERDDSLPNVPVFPLIEDTSVVKLMTNLSKKFKIVIVDCPPADAKGTTKAVLKSDFSIIPVPTTGGGDIRVTEKFLQRLQTLEEINDIDLVAYFLANRHESQVIMHKNVLESFKMYQEAYEVGMLNTIIGKRNAYGEANINGRGVLEGANPKAKKEIEDLTKEVLQIMESL